MKCFSAAAQALHAPKSELQNGTMVPYAEKPDRLAAILDVLPEVTSPEDKGLNPILRVHDPDYVSFLQLSLIHI